LPLSDYNSILLLLSCFLWDWRNIESRKPLTKDLPEIEEDLESPLAVDFALRVTTFDRVDVVFSNQIAFHKNRLTHVELHVAVVSWNIQRFVDASTSSKSSSASIVLLVTCVILLITLVVLFSLGLLILIVRRGLLRVLIVLLLLVIWVALRLAAVGIGLIRLWLLILLLITIPLVVSIVVLV